MGKDKDITFGPDFMSDDLPIFEKTRKEDEYKEKLAQEKAKLSEKIETEKKEKANNTTDKAFLQLVSMVVSQAYISLGAMENPATGTPTPNLEQAKFHVESLTSLYQKTEGNLSEEEEKVFKQALSEIQMMFMELTRASGGGGLPPMSPDPVSPNPPQ